MTSGSTIQIHKFSTGQRFAEVKDEFGRVTVLMDSHNNAHLFTQWVLPSNLPKTARY